MQKNDRLRKMIFTAFLIALEIVLHRYVGIQTPLYQVTLSFVPIALSAMLFGPTWAAFTAFAADFLGAMLNTTGAYNPMFSINVILYAIIYACFFYKKDKTPWRIIVCVLVQLVLVTIPLTPLWLYIYYKYFVGAEQAFGIIFMSKLSAALIEAPVKAVVLIPVCRYIYPGLKKIVNGK